MVCAVGHVEYLTADIHPDLRQFRTGGSEWRGGGGSEKEVDGVGFVKICQFHYYAEWGEENFVAAIQRFLSYHFNIGRYGVATKKRFRRASTR
ncbi:hypothetical protein QE152_g10987 [Popillia japonica]|uniref:Uncharacterized protein n=1 Tax=Popillia japonica TaxID=7064 RepID=A0AAW1LTJ5_POPJA